MVIHGASKNRFYATSQLFVHGFSRLFRGRNGRMTLHPWFQDAAYAGVSSFGFGGTNAHAEAKMGPSFEFAVFTVALLKSG